MEKPVHITQEKYDALAEDVNQLGSECRFIEYPVMDQKTYLKCRLVWERDNTGILWKLITPIVIVS